MTVNKQIKRLDKSNISLTITVPQTEVKAKYQEMIKDYTKNLQLPGFRKGHVPQQVLETKYKEELKQDALGRIIDAALHEVFDDKDLPRNEKPLPYSSPELQGEPALDLEKDFEFSVVYDVIPEVKIGSWKGLKAEYDYAEVTKEDIDRELESLRERNSHVLDKEEGESAATGDTVIIDYQIFEEDGSVLNANKREDFAFTLGTNNNYYQFNDDIIGMKKNDTKEFEKKFSADYFDKDLADKTRKASLTLKELKRKILPDLDDDFAQDVNEKYNTLEDLTNDIRKRLEKSLEVKLRDAKISALLAKIMENTPIILPESMIQAEVEGRLRRLARYYGTDPEKLIQMMKSQEGGDEQMKEWRNLSIRALHSRLIIETLMEEQNIDVTEEELEKEFEDIAAENNTTVEEIKKHYDENAVEYLKEEIKERKLTDIMFAENTLKPGKKENLLDFLNQNS